MIPFTVAFVWIRSAVGLRVLSAVRDERRRDSRPTTGRRFLCASQIGCLPPIRLYQRENEDGDTPKYAAIRLWL